MKSIPIEFELGEVVEIAELKCNGRVVRIAQDGRGVEYQLGYWWNAERKDCWLPASELRPLK